MRRTLARNDPRPELPSRRPAAPSARNAPVKNALRRYRRRQLLRVAQDDGKTFWVESGELVGSAHCLLLARSPAQFAVQQQLRRLDLAAVPRTALLWVNTPEPAQVLVTLALGPQAPLQDTPAVPPRLLVVSGPCGAGKSTLLRQLAAHFPSHVALVPVLTTRAPRKGEDPEGGELLSFTDGRALHSLLARNQLAGKVVAEHDGYSYAVRQAALQQAWAAGKLPVVEAPHALAVALKQAAAALQAQAAAAAAQDGSRPTTPTPAKPSSPPQASPLLVSSLYLHAELELLDVRLRAQGQLEEQVLLHELQVAAAEMQQVAAGEAEFQQAKRAALDGLLVSRLSAPPPAAAPPTGAGAAAAKAAADAAAAQAAAAQAAAQAAAAAASVAPPHVPDFLLRCPDERRGASPLYQQVKEAVASLWHRPRDAVPCQLLLEDFSWRSAQPGRTRQRQRTVMLSGGCLELPRGQHLLRVTAASDYPHAIMFYSQPPCKQDDYYCKANELSIVVGEMMDVMQGQEGEAGAHVTNLDGQMEAAPAPGATLGVLRYQLQVGEPTLVAGALTLAREDVRRATRLLLVDNATGRQHACPSGRLAPVQLEPSPAGYTLLAVATNLGGSKQQQQVAEDGAGEGPVPWFLQLLSSAPLASVQESSVARAQPLQGTYKPNARGVVARHLLTPIQPTQLAVHAALQPPALVPFTVRVCVAPTGGEVVWGEAYPELTRASSPDGAALLLPSVQLEPGKYLVELLLDKEGCPEGWQLDPVSGQLTDLTQPGGGAPAPPLSWTMTLLPSTDDKVCPVTADDSQQRYFRAMQEAWAVQGVPAAAGATAGAGAKGAPAKPAAGKGGAAAGALGGRAAAAASLLEKVVAELAAEAGGGEGAPPVTRPLKDGGVVELKPQERLQLKQASGAVQRPTPEELQQKLLSPAAPGDAGSPAAGAASLAPTLLADKEECAAVRSRRAADFAAWREATTQGLQALAVARLEAAAAAARPPTADAPPPGVAVQ